MVVDVAAVVVVVVVAVVVVVVDVVVVVAFVVVDVVVVVVVVVELVPSLRRTMRRIMRTDRVWLPAGLHDAGHVVAHLSESNCGVDLMVNRHYIKTPLTP